MKGTRCLVTGGAGFIGSHLVARLLREEASVVVLDDFSTGRRENLHPFASHVEMVEASVTDPETCARAVAGVDLIFHLAALGSVTRSLMDPGQTHDVNATGTLNVLIAAREAGVERVVYAASSSAYGDTEELPKHEDMTPRPRSPYAASKLTGEAYCRAFAAAYGLHTVGLRYFNVFGPHQDPHSQYAAVIPLFITAALRGESPTIYGDGEQSRDFTFVDNVLRANLLAATGASVPAGEIFNVGTGTAITVNDLWRLIAELVGVDLEPHHEEPRPGDVRHSLACLERSGQWLGYRPEVDFLEGLRRTIQSYGRTDGVRPATLPRT